MNKKILIVEDEIKIVELLKDYLQKDDFEVDMLHDGNSALEWFNTNTADLLILDIMLPGLDGLSVCRELRKKLNIPIIMVTARVEEIDRLLGLEMGADDYICKPFSPREVVARVKAVLRRLEPKSQVESGFYLDSARHKALYKGNELELTAIEFELLETLYAHPGHIFNRQQLMENIYKDHRIVSDRTVDSHVKKLRQKLKSLSSDSEIIHSVYGVGYKFELK